MPYHRFPIILGFVLAACTLLISAHARPASTRLNPVHEAYPAPRIAFEEEPAEPPSDDSLAAAVADTFSSNPDLAARRYDLRATDDEVGVAMAQTRPQAQVQASGGYTLTLPGTTTQSNRPLSDRLNDPNIAKNDITSQIVLDQPLYTGGRAASALRTAMAASAAGRETLRGAEGDLLVDLVAAYADVRRDRRSLAIRTRNLRTLEATLAEIVARREAGELTRTDIAQTETQLLAARVQVNAAQAQLETSRASFIAIVGREPGNLAPEPDLPGLPASADEAFAIAELTNPELAAAIATARTSRERIAVAQAEGRPEFSLRGTAGTAGPFVPFDRADHDVTFTGRATLTIPLFAGGRIRSLVDQARNRESADTLRIEATRRQLVQAIVNAWNQWVTADRNTRAQELQVRAARIYYEGTLEEYREGLRSTFDVLYAQNSLNETQVALLSSQRDRYLAQAILLRRLGRLETERLLERAPNYDPDSYLRRLRQRSAVPWGGVVRTLDGLVTPGGKPQPIKMPEVSTGSSAATAASVTAPDELLHGGRPSAGPNAPARTDTHDR
ncbi:TolC family outer membrane protein [Novosphingobium sp. MD-1]|uniref:TolC family outer membrane protein n=1 Tax=Novosphingobium sp. MD-1 TaxID=1630648 RepID=UPI00061C6807|nr:TolC family outer membrane protein [Novosphingobium sp. MD-1]GAO52972.1 type I secretion outer membrane protein, tolC precursor [Novosphingobium sp. MD-1]